jgi:pimeloyl-ACP methyl ester carboxylesterase
LPQACVPGTLGLGVVSSSDRGASGLRRRRVEANGIEFEVLEAGSGPLALCLHGFPDSAYTWRLLLPELARAGFRTVAPFMRGYAPTAVAADGCYQLGALVADAVALHEALDGDERAVLIGHDWGAETAYGAAAIAPERWRRLVTIAIPPAALDERIFGDYQQLKRFFYLFLMKSPRAESLIAADDMAFLDRLWEDWSPGYDAAEDVRNAKQCLRDPRNLAAAIAYYRAEEPGLHAVGATDPYAAEHAALLRVAPQPTLYLHGRRDGCIDVALVADAERHLASGSQLAIIEDAGHFPHLERAAAVNERILAWFGLGRRVRIPRGG